jgi:hypothetical protein
MKSIEAIRIPRRGEAILAEHIAPLFRNAKRSISLSEGALAEDFIAASPSAKAKPSYFEGFAEETIPPYSVIGIREKEWGEPPRVGLKRYGITGSGSPFLFVTNGAEEIPEGTWGHVRAVGNWDAVYLQATAGSVPAVGQPCGVLPDSFEISSQMPYGFVCLSEPAPGTDNVVFAMRNQETNLIGVTLAEIPKARGRELGSGQVGVHYLIAGTLEPVINPWSGGPLEVKAYNYCKRKVAEGVNVILASTLGVGFVVKPCCKSFM